MSPLDPRPAMSVVGREQTLAACHPFGLGATSAHGQKPTLAGEVGPPICNVTASSKKLLFVSTHRFLS
jgi:hypothetical protein